MPKNPPERYWQPWIGHWCNVGPHDFGDLTCEQLFACYEFAEGDD
jgi:hypothetical protein